MNTLTPALRGRTFSLRERAGVRVGVRLCAGLAVLALAATMLAACGKKGAPSPPGPPDQIIFPRTYPAY